MTGLINSSILTNPKIRPFGNALADQAMRFSPAASPTPLKGAVAGTSQALTATPSSASGFGEYRDSAGNSYLPGEAGYPAQAQPDGSYRDAGGNAYLPGEAGYPAQAQPDGSYKNAGGSSYLPGEAGYPAQPVPAADHAVAGASPGGYDWDAWSKTDWNTNGQQSEADYNAAHPNQRLDLTPGKEKFVPHPLGNDVASTTADPSPETPETPKATEGDLSNPGDVEKRYADTKDQLPQGDRSQQAIIDQIMRLQSPTDPNLDPWYDRQWQRMKGSLNQEASSRGMYDSGDAMRMLSQSRESLGADQAKAETEYANKAFENNIQRMTAAAQLQGGITDNDIAKWVATMGGANMSQAAEQSRVRGGVQDTLAAADSIFPGLSKAMENLTQADQDAVMKLLADLPAPAQNAENLDAASQKKNQDSWMSIFKLIYGGV